MSKKPKTKERQRTGQQNRSLHLYFTFVAGILVENNIDMKLLLQDGIDIPPTPTNVKEVLWRPIQVAQLGKKSTTQLTTKEIDQIFDTVNRHIAKHGVHIPFPSIKSMTDKLLEYDLE